MIDDEEALLTQILALLLPPLIFGTIPKYFDIAVYTFLSSSPELMITYTCLPIQYLFFYLLFGCSTTTFESLLYNYHFLTQKSLGTSQ